MYLIDTYLNNIKGGVPMGMPPFVMKTLKFEIYS